jgi:outer membrane protein insertion porin family
MESMPRPAHLLALTVLLTAFGTTARTQPARTRTPDVLPIASLTVTGNKTLPADAVLTAAGLKIKGDGGAAIFDAARDRLLATGYFDAVSYTFRQQDSGFAIALTVTEMKQVYPVRTEALPVTPAQLAQILKSGDPLFSGLLPGSKPVIDRAALLIAQSLAASNPGLRVSAKVIPAGGDRYEVQFSPAEGLPVIADITFEGSAVVKDSELHTVMIENGIGQVFSEAGVRDLLDRYARPLFEKQGYMRVSFPGIAGSPAEKVKGMNVHVTVADGPRFKLGALSVRGGPDTLDKRRILRIANLPQSDFANGDDITQGVTRIHDTLRGEGYLDAAVSTGRSIDNSTRTVDIWFEVDPGAVYTFGRLEVLGLGLDGEDAIRKLWSVKPGDPFPGAYPDYFVTTLKSENLFDNLGGITATPAIDRQTRVVNVALRFESAPPPPRRGTANR